jgi:hypothetical protein
LKTGPDGRWICFTKPLQKQTRGNICLHLKPPPPPPPPRAFAKSKTHPLTSLLVTTFFFSAMCHVPFFCAGLGVRWSSQEIRPPRGRIFWPLWAPWVQGGPKTSWRWSRGSNLVTGPLGHRAFASSPYK